MARSSIDWPRLIHAWHNCGVIYADAGQGQLAKRKTRFFSPFSDPCHLACGIRMTGILGGGSNAKQNNVAGSLQFQTSQRAASSRWSMARRGSRRTCSTTTISLPTHRPASGSKGKGGGRRQERQQPRNYSASIILGLCQGPVAGFGQVWFNKNQCALTALPGLSTTNVGTDGQSADPFWAANHPAKAIGYSGTANFTLDNYQLGMTAALPNFNVESHRHRMTSGSPNGFDANPAAIVIDFLTNARYGAGFPPANLDSLSSVFRILRRGRVVPVASR